MKDIAAAMCSGLGFNLFEMPAAVIPEGAVDFESLTRLWVRESILSRSALLLHLEADAGAAITRHVQRFIEEVQAPLLVVSRDRLPMQQRPVLVYEVKKTDNVRATTPLGNRAGRR